MKQLNIWNLGKIVFVVTLAMMISCAPDAPPNNVSTPAAEVVPDVETETNVFKVVPSAGWVQYNSPAPIDNSSYFGRSMAVGDFNNDGINDLAAGVPYADLEGANADTGGITIFYLESSPSSSIDLEIDQFIKAPTVSNNNIFGFSLLSEDINGDGFIDLVAGAPNEEPGDRGAVYIYYGSSSGLSMTPDQTLVQPTGTNSSGFGSSLAMGDFDKDGNRELVVGSFYDDSTTTNAGSVWIFQGQSGGLFSSGLATEITDATGSVNDYFGTSVSVFDYTGDGNLDLIVGAPGEDTAALDSGMIFIYNGTGTTSWVTSITVFDSSIQNPLGMASDNFGWSIDAGDINGDSKVDLIVGVPLNDQFGTNQGLALVFYDIQAAPTVDYIVPGSQGDFNSSYSGYGLKLLDFDGDGELDFLYGSALYSSDYGYRHGKIDLYLSDSFGIIYFDTPVRSFYPNYLTEGKYKSYNDNFGWAVCKGDLNGDGKDDLIVGAAFDDGKWGDDGRLYVYYSRPNGTYYNQPDLTIDSAGYRATARAYGSACFVADINGDSKNDLLVGAQYDDIGGTNAGALFVHFGTASSVNVVPGLTVVDPGDNNNGFGKSISMGDINNDGFNDLVVGAYLDDTGGADRGVVYVYESDNTTGVIDFLTPTTFQTVTSNTSYYGYAVDIMDYDGDGDSDLLVGVPYDDTQAANSGRVVIYINAGTANTLLDTTADSYVYHPTNTANSQFGSAVAHGKYLNATYDDLFIGSLFDDSIYANAGAVYGYKGSVSGPSAAYTSSYSGVSGSASVNQGFGSAIMIMDFNQDSSNDLVIGASYDDNTGRDAGSVFVKVE